MADVPRYAEKMTSLDGSTISVDFPLYQYQYSPSQTLRTALLPLIGAHYAYDQLGQNLAVKDVSREQIKALVVRQGDPAGVDSDLSDLRQKLYHIGQGRLYTIDVNGVERWAYARLLDMPTSNWQVGDVDFLEAAIGIVRFSDWYDTTQYDQTFTIDADPKTITVTNDGSERVYNAVLILKGTYASGWNIHNTNNGYQIGANHGGAASSDWLKVDAGVPSMMFSSDSGATYSGIFGAAFWPAGQVQLMILEPGNNVLSVTGANGADLEVIYWPPYLL